MNNQITETGASSAIAFVQGGEAVTTSLAIAEGTQNDHASVIKLVRSYKSDLEEFGQVRFEIRLNTQGSGTEFAVLNEEQATLIMTYMKNGPVARQFKKALVRAFYELKKQAVVAPAPDLNDPDTLRGLLLNYSAEVKNLRATVTEQAPKVAALDLLATASEGSVNLTNAAKLIDMNPKAFMQWLFGLKWIYKRAGSTSWVAYQDKLQSGLLDTKLHTVHHSDGEKIHAQVIVTAKGLARLAQMHGAPLALN